MDVKVTDAGPCRKVLAVAAPAEAVAGAYSETVRAFASAARLPGFRPGKAPLPVVEKHYAKEIAAEARDRLVPQLYREALESQGIHPVAIVEVSEVAFAKASGLSFQVTVDVAPDFKLPAYKKLKANSNPVQVTDAQVDEAVLRMRERLARFADADAQRAAQADDLLKADFQATVDGQPLSTLAPKEQALGEAKDFMLFIGEPEFLPGFNAALTGARAGEARSVTVIFPDNYPVTALAKRTAQYEVKVLSVQARVLPELNEDFLKHFEVDSEAALRSKFRTGLEEGARNAEAGRQKDDLAKQLLQQTPFAIPQSVVERETQHAVRGMVQDIARRGASREQIVEQQEQIVSEATRSSTERVRLTYILSRIADEEKIEVTDDELDAQVQAMAARYQMTPERLREELDRRQALEGLRRDMRSEKALTFLQQQTQAS